jgi:predicted permease
VVSAADATVVQLSGTSWGNKVWMDGGNSTHAPEAHFSRVSPEYFRTLSIPLLAGRDFEAHDTHGAPNVAIVNQTFARRIANGANPIGRRFRVEATPATPEMVYEIVGLVADTKYLRLREPFGPLFYVPIAQDPSPSLSDQLLIRTSAPTGTLFPALRRAIAEADPEARFTFYAYRERIEGALRSERLMATLSTAFGILAALLSAIGLHGVMSYMVARRRNELGIRMALGADRRRIIALVMRESANVLAIGLAAGAALSIYAASFARKLLFGLTPYDPATLLTTALLLAAVAFAATWIPARRAASQDPTTALRDE